jgi:hypothetical protein
MLVLVFLNLLFPTVASLVFGVGDRVPVAAVSVKLDDRGSALFVRPLDRLVRDCPDCVKVLATPLLPFNTEKLCPLGKTFVHD